MPFTQNKFTGTYIPYTGAYQHPQNGIANPVFSLDFSYLSAGGSLPAGSKALGGDIQVDEDSGGKYLTSVSGDILLFPGVGLVDYTDHGFIIDAGGIGNKYSYLDYSTDYSVCNNTIRVTIGAGEKLYSPITVYASRPSGIPDNTLWKPTDISTLYAWYRSDKGITKDGDNYVSKWEDQSGNGNDLIQATYSQQPRYTPNRLNYCPTLVFSGGASGDMLYTGGSITFPIGLSMFAVGKINNNSGDGSGCVLRIFGSTSVNCPEGTSRLLWCPSFDTKRGVTIGDASGYQSLDFTKNNEWKSYTIMEWYSDGIGANFDQLYKGVSVKNGTPETTADPLSGTITSILQIGAGYNPALGTTNGEFAEIIIANTQSVEVRTQIRAYLAKRYGL